MPSSSPCTRGSTFRSWILLPECEKRNEQNSCHGRAHRQAEHVSTGYEVTRRGACRTDRNDRQPVIWQQAERSPPPEQEQHGNDRRKHDGCSPVVESQI